MNEIKCPNCGKVFQIDESSYESIVKQIRDQEFEKEISTREKQYQNDIHDYSVFDDLKLILYNSLDLFQEK